MVALLALLVIAGCSAAGGAGASRTGNARVAPSDEGGRPSPSGSGTGSGTGSTSRSAAASTPGGSDGTLSSTELGLVYQFILQRYIEQTDHAALVEAAVTAVRETGLKSN